MAKTAPSRGLRDEMNVGPDPRNARQLVPLRDLGKFKISDGEPDVRGWTVYTSTGREIGRVHELLVDTDARQVVMLDIDLRRDDRHTIVPIRASWIDQSTKRVVVDSAEVTGDDAASASDSAAAASAVMASGVMASDVMASDVAASDDSPAVANRPDVLQDWQPAGRPVTTESPAVAASDVTRPSASERLASDRPVVTERVVQSRPVVEEVVVRRREVGAADLPESGNVQESGDDSLLRGRPDDVSGPPI